MNKTKKSLMGLLERLEKETFYGDEISHLPISIKIEYSPGKLGMIINNPVQPKKGYLEMAFSETYEITSYKEGFEGDLKDFSEDRIKKIRKYGIIGNHFRRDPRYVLRNSKDFKKVSEGVYSMTIWDDAAKELSNLNEETDGTMSDIIQCAEICLEDDNLKKMVVKTQFLKKSGVKEKLFTDINFYKP
ncbi:MAG: hypothetical protein Q8N77_01585 [Nanoarchaeota archaeon]|nr:hypothetical protein [Nanoarchaeota archaeon]